MESNELQQITQRNWRRFLGTYEPLRPDLFRYCRYLTRSPWDAEDLAQDTLARAFVTLAQMSAEPPNPRAWLFRVASNLWVDTLRKQRPLEPPAQAATTSPHAQATREAAGTLLVRLAPQERAAVVLKDVFDLTADEIAETLETSVGAVKAALHRGRDKLSLDAEADDTKQPVPEAVDAFCRAFNAADIDGLAALLVDNSVVRVCGATTQYGREAAKRTVLWGMLFGTRLMVSDRNPLDPALTAGVLPMSPRVEPRLHRGAWVLVHWYRHEGDVEAVRAFTTLRFEGERVSHLVNHFYTPDLLIELGAELGVPVRINGYRWWRGEA